MQIYQIVKYLKYIQYCNNWIFIHSHWWMNEKARHFHQKLLATAKGINCFANSFGAAAIFWQISKLTLLCTFWSSWQQFPAVYCPLKSVLTRRCLSNSRCSVSNASPPWDSSCLSGEIWRACITWSKGKKTEQWIELSSDGQKDDIFEVNETTNPDHPPSPVAHSTLPIAHFELRLFFTQYIPRRHKKEGRKEGRERGPAAQPKSLSDGVIQICKKNIVQRGE